MKIDLYKILGIKKKASNKDIKNAYRDKAKKYHPDKNKGDKKSQEEFVKVKKAYETLIDVEKRKFYDETGFVDDDINKQGDNVLNVMASYFVDAIEKINFNAKCESVFDILKDIVDKEIEIHKGVIRKNEHILDKYNNIEERTKNLDDFLSAVMENQKSKHSQNIYKTNKQLGILNDIRERIVDYEYEIDKEAR